MCIKNVRSQFVNSDLKRFVTHVALNSYIASILCSLMYILSFIKNFIQCNNNKLIDHYFRIQESKFVNHYQNLKIVTLASGVSQTSTSFNRQAQHTFYKGLIWLHNRLATIQSGNSQNSVESLKYTTSIVLRDSLQKSVIRTFLQFYDIRVPCYWRITCSCHNNVKEQYIIQECLCHSTADLNDHALFH